jgi:hypothetical protein
MFQFTTTNIINSNLDSNGTLAKYSGDASAFTVTRVGRFLAANIVGDVEKRSYQPGVLEEAQVTIPVITAGLVARLDVDVRLSQQTHSEYANSYLYFKKPVCVEVLATGVAATDAAALVAQLNGLKDRFGHSYITAVANGADIVLTAKDFHQRFFDVKILEEDPDAMVNTIIEPVFLDVTAGTFAINTAGRIGFGNDEWMYARIRMRSLDNHRPFGISQDEKPVIGGNYTQFTLRYQVAKDHVDGVSLANDTSITTHVFYVKSDLVAAFEAEVANTVTVNEIVGGGVIVISGTTSLTNSQVVTLTAGGAVGAVTWEVVSGTSATVTNASTGEITADGAIDGDTVIKVTDSEGSTAQVTVTVA